MKALLDFIQQSGVTGVTLKVPFFELSLAFREDSAEGSEDTPAAVSMGFRMEEPDDEDE